MKNALKQIVKFFVYIACYIIYPFSFLFPRNKKMMAYGCFHGAFIDNPKYVFIYANEHYPQYEHIWLSTRRDTIRYVRQLG